MSRLHVLMLCPKLIPSLRQLFEIHLSLLPWKVGTGVQGRYRSNVTMEKSRNQNKTKNEHTQTKMRCLSFEVSTYFW